METLVSIRHNVVPTKRAVCYMPTSKSLNIPGVGVLPPDEVLARAMTAHSHGDLKTANSLARRILSRYPNQPNSLYLCGIIAHQRGKLASAEKYLRRAIKAAPENPLGHGGLGILRLTEGKLTDAIALFERALSISHEQPHIHNNLGLTLARLGQSVEAASHYDTALEIAPHYSDAWLNLGKLRQDENRLDDAKDCYENALKYEPNMAEAHSNLGNIHHQTGQVDEALAAYARAENANPQYVEAIFNKAIIQAEIGRIEEAIDSYRAVVDANPHHIEAVCGLGEALEVIGKEAEAEACYRTASKISPRQVPEESATRLHYKLGRSFDRLGNYDKAFAEFRTANELRAAALRRSGQIYNRVHQEGLVDRIIASFQIGSAAEWRKLGVSDHLPIFVLGMPRSGTTLTEQILASHPSVHGAGELKKIPQIGQDLSNEGSWPDNLSQLDHSLATTLATSYIKTLKGIAPNAMRVVDKLPTNFLYVGLIRTLMPSASIVHMRRNPLDTCVSNYFQNFGEAAPHNHDLGDLGHYYRQYVRLMAHWEAVFPGSIFHLDYEQLVDEQEATSRKLIDWCGLEWDDRCMDFHTTDRTVQTASYLQVRRPIYGDSVTRWRHYEQYLRPLTSALDS